MEKIKIVVTAALCSVFFYVALWLGAAMCQIFGGN